MTRDDIIRLAKEAGISKPWDQEPVKWETLERFANLIVAAERERKAWNAEYWTEYEQDVAAAEREACAKLCEEISDDEYYLGRQYADMLRARGLTSLQRQLIDAETLQSDPAGLKVRGQG